MREKELYYFFFSRNTATGRDENGGFLFCLFFFFKGKEGEREDVDGEGMEENEEVFLFEKSIEWKNRAIEGKIFTSFNGKPSKHNLSFIAI